MNIDVAAPGLTTTFGGAIGASTTDVVKNGLGTLIFANNANAFEGVITVNRGLVFFGGDTAMGVAPSTFRPDAITLNNGGGIGTTANTNLGLNRGVVLNGGGVLSPNSGTTLTIVAPVTGTGGLSLAGNGTAILGDVSWSLRAGEHWLIRGANGSGKSTFLRLLRGEIWPAPKRGERIYRLDGSVQMTAVEVRRHRTAVTVGTEKPAPVEGYSHPEILASGGNLFNHGL
jgi:hypothetical protein